MSRFSNLEFDEGRESTQEQRAPEGKVECLARAEAALQMGDFEEALRAYSKVLEYDPDCVLAWHSQVLMLFELQEMREAKLWADKALERFPKDAELLAAKAMALARTGDLEGAIAFSDASLEVKGSTPFVWLVRGDVLLARSEKSADYCFHRALLQGNRNWFVHWLASRIHAFYGKFAKALKYAQQALTLDATHAVIWLQLGLCQRACGLIALAEGSFRQSLELNPACLTAEREIRSLSEMGFLSRLLSRAKQVFRNE